MATKTLKRRHRYLAEFNRCVGDNIARVMRRLQRRGYTVERAPQLTAITIKLPKGSAFSDLCAELRELIQPRRGSLTLASTSGRIWSCSNRGNRPGEFVRIL